MSSPHVTWAQPTVGSGHSRSYAQRDLNRFNQAIPARHRYRMLRDNIQGISELDVNNPSCRTSWIIAARTDLLLTSKPIYSVS